MDNLSDTSKYELTKKEENDYINKINDLLKSFERHIDEDSSETNYFFIIPSQNIIELMLKLLLKKEGYSIAETLNPNKLIQYSAEHDLIPRKYEKNLHKIRIIRNKYVHGQKPSYKEAILFLNEFSEFVKWFDTFYSNNYDIKNPFNIKETILKIDSLTTPPNNEKNITKKSINSTGDIEFAPTAELETISQINELLNNYEKQLKDISAETYYYFIVEGRIITELMLKLLLRKEEGHDFSDFPTIYAISQHLYKQNIIPEECFNFINLIRIYSNKFLHDYSDKSDKSLISFLGAFSYFIQWFDNYYVLNYQKNFKIKKCCEIIDSIEYDEITKTINYTKKEKTNVKTENEELINQIQELNEILNHKKEILKQEKAKNEINLNENKCKTAEYNQFETLNEINRLNNEVVRLTEKLNSKDQYLKKLEENVDKCLSLLIKNDERGDRIESKIDDMTAKIDNITHQITIIQSYNEKLIDNAQSEEEIERIIGNYIDNCIENISSLNFNKTQEYYLEEKKLIFSMGEGAWNKLCDKSKKFLITSKVMYNHLFLMEDIVDYSSVCVHVTKALEVEMHKRFYSNFLKFLNDKYGSDYKKYPTGLLYKYKKPLLSEKFSMGNIIFVLCPNHNRHDSDEQKTNNKITLMKYCKERIFSKYTENEIEQLLSTYASAIEEIRTKYRNPSAHTNEIKMVEASECFDLVLDVEKLLKKMLDSFDE